MYLTIEYPNYPIISLLTQPRGNCVKVVEIRVSTSRLELEFSPPQLNVLPLSYDAPYISLFLFQDITLENDDLETQSERKRRLISLYIVHFSMFVVSLGINHFLIYR